MTTTSEAPEVWRVECEGGDVVTATVVRARQGGSVAVCGAVDVWSATRDDAVPYYAREASGDTPRQAVTALAARGGLPVVAVLAPGQPTRAEVEAELRDARAEADDLRAAARAYNAAVRARDAASRYGTDAELAAATDRYAEAAVALREALDATEPANAAALRAAMGGAK